MRKGRKYFNEMEDSSETERRRKLWSQKHPYFWGSSSCKETMEDDLG
jgi:hypothetical protein